MELVWPIYCRRFLRKERLTVDTVVPIRTASGIAAATELYSTYCLLQSQAVDYTTLYGTRV